MFYCRSARHDWLLVVRAGEAANMLHSDIFSDTMDLSVKVPPPLQAIFHEQAKSIIAIKVSSSGRYTKPVRELSQPVWASDDMWDSQRVREGETPCSNMLSELSAGSGEVTTNNTITPANSSRHRKLVRNREIFSHSFNENISRTVKSIIDV